MKKLFYKPYRLTVKVAKKITNFDYVITENHYLKLQNEKLEKDYNFGWPKGHFYSPVHSTDDLKDYEKVLNRSKGKFANTIPGFSKENILKEFNMLKKYFKDFDFPEEEDGASRFYHKNISLPIMDSLLIFSMIRDKKPKRIVEIGSGFSSGLMMEVNEKYFNSKIKITFIEPYPAILNQRMKKGDKSKYKVIPTGVQDVPLDVFKQLEKDDILFIDSTHVSKFNSDVNYEIFDILPELKKGVIIHFHDIIEGFEYPKVWLDKGWAWNEAYLLRAYLTNNYDYNVLLMTNFITNHFPELVKKSFPNHDDEILNGGSLWLVKK